MLFRFNVVLLECLLQNHKEILDVLGINLTQGAESECIGRAYLSGINRKPSLIAIVVNLLEIPVRVIRVFHGNNQSGLYGRINNCLQSKFIQPLMNSLINRMMTGKLCLLST